MSIPARPGYDVDLLLTDAADEIERLREALRAPETPPVHAVVFEAFKTGRQSVLDEQAEKTATDIERLRQIADEIEYPMPGTATRLREIAQRYEIVAGAYRTRQAAPDTSVKTSEYPEGAVPVVKPQGTGETGDDRPAAPISSGAAEKHVCDTYCIHARRPNGVYDY